MSSLYVSTRYIKLLLDVAAYRGLPREALWRRIGVDVPPPEDSDVRVSADQYYDLWAAAMQELRDPALPIRVAKRMTASKFDMLGFAMLTSGNLLKTMLLIQRYQPFVTNAAQWEIQQGKEASFFAPRLVGTPRAEHRYAEEFALAHIVLMARAFTGADVSPMEVCSAHPEPPDTAAQRALFGAPLRFDAPVSGLWISRSVLELPFLKADEELAAHFASHLDKVVTAEPPSLATRARREIAESLPRQDYSLEYVARQLNYSPRTLRRHLKDEGLTFQQLVDEVRTTMAKRHLRDGVLALGEIAFVLGYSEASAFHRAFRRWTGVTPDDYRSGKTSP